MPASRQVNFEVPVVWSQEHPRPIPANVFIVHRNANDEVLLFFGHVAPVISGSAKEQIAQVQALASEKLKVEVDPVIVLPLKVAQQLSTALNVQLQEQKS